jgi:hypothetical protein
MRLATQSTSIGARIVVRRFWRLYALCCLVAIGFFVNSLIGPGSAEPFARDRAVDFGAFYSGATLAWEGRLRDLVNQDAQRATQTEIQERERTGWRWYNTLPNPPVLSIIIAPLAALPLRTAYWLWMVIGLAAAAGAAWCLARRSCPMAIGATAIVLFSFEPIWDVAWWGQLDNLILLPVALGVVLLLSGKGNRRDVAAGVLLGALALKPIFVPVPFLALAWGRRPAALGMAGSGGLMAAISLVAIGLGGVRDYIKLSGTYRGFAGTPYIVEWRMFNMRGLIIRLGLGLDHQEQFRLAIVAMLLLGALAVAAAGSALSQNRSPDLALSVMVLGMLLTAYHVHVQSLVYLTVPLAMWIGRSLVSAGATRLTWVIPVVAIHAGAFLLRPDKPSPAPSEARVETFLTVCMLAALVVLAVWLLLGEARVRDPKRIGNLLGRPSSPDAAFPDR